MSGNDLEILDFVIWRYNDENNKSLNPKISNLKSQIVKYEGVKS